MTAAIEFHAGDEEQIPLHGDADFVVGAGTGAIYSKKAHSLDYGPDYFLEEYRQQYGRSYLEDESHLRALARRRLSLLGRASLAKRTGHGRARLFEIGCAAGFFLDEARALGFDVSGVEISEYACRHARDSLNIAVQCGSFLELAPPPASVDVIAAFYVLEHFAAQRSAFERLSAALKPGGVFLFAFPSTHGPLFATNREEWKRGHPADHFVDYGPASLSRALEIYGLSAMRFRPSSYHPRRARDWRGGLWFRPFYRTYANVRCFGDTFEGLAMRRI